MTKNQQIGKYGEDLAVKHLVKQGYRILVRNHKERADEIDIIAQDRDGALVFCEVKTRAIHGHGGGLTPEDNLTGAKLRKIRRSAEFFVRKYPATINEASGWRIDLIAVELVDVGEIASSVKHYKNV